MLSHEEIIDHTRRETIKWLELPGNDTPQHELEAAADRLMVITLACQLSNAMTCASLTEPYLAGNEQAIRQLWNW